MRPCARPPTRVNGVGRKAHRLFVVPRATTLLRVGRGCFCLPLPCHLACRCARDALSSSLHTLVVVLVVCTVQLRPHCHHSIRPSTTPCLTKITHACASPGAVVSRAYPRGRLAVGISSPLLPRKNTVKQRLWAIVRLLNMGNITVSCYPILEVPLDNPSIKPPGMLKQVVNVGLFTLPQLGKAVLTQGVDETIGMEHMRGPVQRTLHPTSANTPPPEYTHSSCLRHTDNDIAWR
jgi:hypothetical protein